MKQYLDLVRQILDTGVRKPNRTGIDTISTFGLFFRHDLSEGFPLLTTKKMDGKLWNSIVEELLWFIRGQTHIRELKEKSSIWNAWADENGELETSYGWYWRHYPFAFNGEMVDWDNSGEGAYRYWDTIGRGVGNFDQLGHCVEQLKTNPNSRRLVVLAWEPFNAHKSKLPPCHLLYIFNVQDGRLCLHMTQRSCDFGLGVGFNIASYALLTHIIAQEVGLKPGMLAITFVDAHIYCADKDDMTLVNGVPRKEYDHVSVMQEQLLRQPYSLPRIAIAERPWDQHVFDDFKLIGYQSHGPLKMRVAV